jgi:hypothetical protein
MRSSYSRQGPTPAEEVAALKASLAEMEMRNGWVMSKQALLGSWAPTGVHEYRPLQMQECHTT